MSPFLTSTQPATREQTLVSGAKRDRTVGLRSLLARGGGPGIVLALLLAGAAPGHAQIGTPVCATSWPHTSLMAFGSTVVSLHNLELLMLTQGPAYFMCSRTLGQGGLPGGNPGGLCLGRPIGRGGAIGSLGFMGTGTSRPFGQNVLPMPGGPVAALPGDTWYFQAWSITQNWSTGDTTMRFSGGLALTFTDGSEVPRPELVPIPAGTFMMGAAPATIVREVHISRPFWMGRYEVSNAELHAVLGTSSWAPPWQWNIADFPAVTTWYAALEYCAALNELEAGNLPSGYHYRLPTEAEWEYACRAGTTTEFSFGSSLRCDQARFWYQSTFTVPCPGGYGLAAVGSHEPNRLGVHDMHGNVREWCLDGFAEYTPGPATDPFVSPSFGLYQCVRGGHAGSAAWHCGSAVRDNANGDDPAEGAGFRVVLAPILNPW